MGALPDGHGVVALTGYECADDHGGGIATVTAIAPDGTTTAPMTASADDDGMWELDLALFEQLPHTDGVYEVHATCDLYTETLVYEKIVLNPDGEVREKLISVSQTTVEAGQSITISTTGFAEPHPDDYNNQGSFWLDPTFPVGVLPEGQKLYEWPSVHLGTVSFDVGGNASITATIPADTAPGEHAIGIIEMDTGAYTVITVTAPSGDAGPAANASDKSLANTGVDAGTLGLIAGVAVLTGGAALYVGRRNKA